ncbi:MAG: CsbD family protein [Sphingomonas phyllosphaerae]|uniref:CsbD family protein n=1 Tax=Sphingomonas phyllosphaerae TaxID=257003 RepID=UPI002FFB6A46
MNKHELHGGARYVGGKVEEAVGDVADRRDWQADGVLNQVAGGAENLFGRAQSIASDVADMTPGLIEEARERIGDTADRAAAATRHGAQAASMTVRENKGATLALVAALGGVALGWLLFARRR